MVEFLNCNYPNKLTIIPGKPKNLPKEKYKIVENNVTLYAISNNEVWFSEKISGKSYYFGIKFDLIKKFNIVDQFATKGSINIVLLDWNGETLSNTQESLLDKHLMLIR